MAGRTRNENTDFLIKAILSLSDADECYDFLEDLCTVAELNEMSRRMTAAKMLSDNKIYTEIAEKTGLSTATISRVNRCLKYGNDGYLKILQKLKQSDEGKSQDESPI